MDSKIHARLKGKLNVTFVRNPTTNVSELDVEWRMKWGGESMTVKAWGHGGRRAGNIFSLADHLLLW